MHSGGHREFSGARNHERDRIAYGISALSVSFVPLVQISQIFLKHFADAEFDVFCLRDMAFEIPGEVQRATDKCPSINVVCSNSGEWRVRPKPDRGEIREAFTVRTTHCCFRARGTTVRRGLVAGENAWPEDRQSG